MTKWDILGSFLIMTCVALIGIGGVPNDEDKAKVEEKLKDPRYYLILSIIGCLIIGLFFSFMSLAMSFVAKSGSSVVQANYDSDFLNCFIYLPVFTILMIKDGSTYDLDDVIIGSMIRFCITTGLILYGYAFQYAKAGPV